MKFFDIDQQTEEWWEQRRGIPTGSMMSKIITPKTGKLSAQSLTYIAELIDQSVSGYDEGFSTQWTERGKLMEDEAIDWYRFDTGASVDPGGFFTNDDETAGASPDGLIGEDGLLEVKAPKGTTHVKWVLAGGLPDEHKPQCHAELLLSERKWLDFVSYHPSYKPLLVRVVPDEYTEKLSEALNQFIEKLRECRDRVAL